MHPTTNEKREGTRLETVLKDEWTDIYGSSCAATDKARVRRERVVNSMMF
jgi:hypothetical protein